MDPTLAPYIVPRISAIEEAISNLNIQSQIGASRLSNAMSETASAGAMLSMTVDQLQSSLNEINAQGVSALSSADLTGILTMGNISSILEAQNFAMPAGYITENGTDMMVSLGDKFKSINEIEELVLLDTGIPGTGAVTVADVARVRDFSDSENVYAKINGEAGSFLLSASNPITPPQKQPEIYRINSKNLKRNMMDLSSPLFPTRANTYTWP